MQSTGCRHPHWSADRAVVTHTGQQTVQSSPTCDRSSDRAVVTHTGQQTVQSSPTQISRPSSRHAHRSTVRPTRHDAAGQAGAASLQPDAETPSSSQICQRTGERTVRREVSSGGCCSFCPPSCHSALLLVTLPSLLSVCPPSCHSALHLVTLPSLLSTRMSLSSFADYCVRVS